ncbi:MAG: hypothetical protein ACOCXP_01840 [Candidatus Dojkabacteria bacterium]
MRIKKMRGSVALTTVILTSAILVSAGISLLITSIDLSRARQGHGAQIQASIQMNSCKEEALRRIEQDNNFTGSISISEQGEQLCEVVVSTDMQNGDIKILELSVTVREYSSSETVRRNLYE